MTMTMITGMITGTEDGSACLASCVPTGTTMRTLSTTTSDEDGWRGRPNRPRY